MYKALSLSRLNAIAKAIPIFVLALVSSLLLELSVMIIQIDFTITAYWHSY